jgi:hypothetical protein
MRGRKTNADAALIETINKNSVIYIKDINTNNVYKTFFTQEHVFMPYNTRLYRATVQAGVNDSPNFAGKIPPGMPCHACDLNPRSCLFIDNNNNVCFVNVEGRNYDGGGSGLDLFQLAKIVKALGAVDAINLDGGGSAILSWKEETRLNIATSNDNGANTKTKGQNHLYTIGNGLVVLNN